MATSKAMKTMKKARVHLITRHPFFGALAFHLDLIEDGSIPTCGTDGDVLIFNPEFVQSMTFKQTLGAVAHEILHCAFLHPLRRFQRNPLLWNWAGDYAINIILKEEKFELIEGALYDLQYAGMNVDEIYNILLRKTKEIPNYGGPGVPIAIPGHGTACGGILDKKGKNGKALSKGSVDSEASKMKGRVAKAAAIARARGKMTGSLEKWVNDFLNPRINWVDQLRRFFEQSTKNDYTWTRPNRRYLQQGIYLPTLHNQEMATLIIAIDSSGSVSDDELQQFGGEINGLLQTVKVAVVYVLYCDSELYKVDEFTPNDFPIKFTSLKRGGTNFTPPFEWVEKNDQVPSCFIYMTDMECWDYPPTPDYPVLWLSTESEKNIKKPPFGEIIYMPK